MDLYERYELTRVINACGKMTHLSAAIVLPEIIEAVTESLKHFFVLDELQEKAGDVIARATGAEHGCVTACTSSGITLAVAAAMTGQSIGKIHQLPDTTGMPSRVIVQKGHVVDYGAPIAQAVRLAGAELVEVGSVNRCIAEEIEYELQKGDVTAVLAVESHHTVRFGYVTLPEVVEIAHSAGVPVIVDGAAQDHRLTDLISAGSDVVICSSHKYLCGPTAGIVAGTREMVSAVYAQNKGIGRGMKAGKEAIIGAMAALEYRMREDVAAWTEEQDRKVKMILELLDGITGLSLDVEVDPNGCPFSRAKLTPDPETTGHTAASLTEGLADGNPTVVARAHHADEGYIYLDAIEMTDEEIAFACKKVRSVLGAQ